MLSDNPSKRIYNPKENLHQGSQRGSYYFNVAKAEAEKYRVSDDLFIGQTPQEHKENKLSFLRAYDLSKINNKLQELKDELDAKNALMIEMEQAQKVISILDALGAANDVNQTAKDLLDENNLISPQEKVDATRLIINSIGHLRNVIPDTEPNSPETAKDPLKAPISIEGFKKITQSDQDAITDFNKFTQKIAEEEAVEFQGISKQEAIRHIYKTWKVYKFDKFPTLSNIPEDPIDKKTCDYLAEKEITIKDTNRFYEADKAIASVDGHIVDINNSINRNINFFQKADANEQQKLAVTTRKMIENREKLWDRYNQLKWSKANLLQKQLDERTTRNLKLVSDLYKKESETYFSKLSDSLSLDSLKNNKFSKKEINKIKDKSNTTINENLKNIMGNKYKKKKGEERIICAKQYLSDLNKEYIRLENLQSAITKDLNEEKNGSDTNENKHQSRSFEYGDVPSMAQNGMADIVKYLKTEKKLVEQTNLTTEDKEIQTNLTTEDKEIQTNLTVEKIDRLEREAEKIDRLEREAEKIDRLKSDNFYLKERLSDAAVRNAELVSENEHLRITSRDILQLNSDILKANEKLQQENERLKDELGISKIQLALAQDEISRWRRNAFHAYQYTQSTAHPESTTENEVYIFPDGHQGPRFSEIPEESKEEN